MAQLNYVDKTSQDVTIKFGGMNAGTVLVFVNHASGKPISSPAFALSGSGKIDIPIFPTLPTGQYHLLARWAGQNVAQTVPFYINN